MKDPIIYALVNWAAALALLTWSLWLFALVSWWIDDRRKKNDTAGVPIEPQPAESGPGDQQPDPVNHPPHYTSHPSGIETIQVTEHMGFNLGNAIKYIWRADLKGDAIDDLRKATWYVNREIERRKGMEGKQ